MAQYHSVYCRYLTLTSIKAGSQPASAIMATDRGGALLGAILCSPNEFSVLCSVAVLVSHCIHKVARAHKIESITQNGDHIKNRQTCKLFPPIACHDSAISLGKRYNVAA